MNPEDFDGDMFNNIVKTIDKNQFDMFGFPKAGAHTQIQSQL